MLSKAQMKELRGMSHALPSMVQIGKSGLSANLFQRIDEELEAHELVKITALKTADLDIDETAGILARETDAQIVQVIGKTIVLYRRSKENKLGLRP